MEFILGVTPHFCSRPLTVSSTLLQSFSPGKLELPIPSQNVFLFMLVHITIVNIFFHFPSVMVRGGEPLGSDRVVSVFMKETPEHSLPLLQVRTQEDGHR